MAKISIRPDLRTAGGEINDIILNGRYVGGISLVYREGNRLSGAVQLERSSLAAGQKKHVIRFVQEYIDAMAAALDVVDCDVVVTYSHFDQVLATEQNVGEIAYFYDDDMDVTVDDADHVSHDMTDDEMESVMYEMDDEMDGEMDDVMFDDMDAVMDDDLEADYIDTDTTLSDYEPDSADTYEMYRGRAGFRTKSDAKRQTKSPQRAANSHAGKERHAHNIPRSPSSHDAELYELVITGEHGNSIEYHIYGQNKRWLAEAFVTLYGSDVIGEINWMAKPSSEQIENAIDLLVSDFDDDLIDSFQLEVKHNGELIEVFELDHKDLVEDESDVTERGNREEEYSVHLVRDDGDTLTYEIYARLSGGLPIGTATVDISHRKLSGFMEFREMNSEEDRERIAALLMRELDKEKDFDSFSLTVLYKNRPIDELLFENVPLQ